MTQSATVRNYVSSDLDSVIALARELQAHEIQFFDRLRPTPEIGVAYINKILSELAKHKGQMLIAESDGKIVGYASLFVEVVDDDPEVIAYSFSSIGDLVVSEHHRGHGVGQLLMATCERIARENGQKWLRLSVIAGNASARRFYERAGLEDHVYRLEKKLT